MRILLPTIAAAALAAFSGTALAQTQADAYYPPEEMAAARAALHHATGGARHLFFRTDRFEIRQQRDDEELCDQQHDNIANALRRPDGGQPRELRTRTQGLVKDEDPPSSGGAGPKDVAATSDEAQPRQLGFSNRRPFSYKREESVCNN